LTITSLIPSTSITQATPAKTHFLGCFFVGNYASNTMVGPLKTVL